MLETILNLRNKIISVCRYYEAPALPVVKFLVGFILALALSRLSCGEASVKIILAVSAVSGALFILANTAGALIILTIAASVFIGAASIETAAIMFAALIMVLIFSVSAFPKESAIIPALILGFYIGVPYIAVLIGAAVFGIGCIVPLCGGCAAYYLLQNVPELVKLSEGGQFSLLSSMDSFLNIFTAMAERFKADTSWIWYCVIFAAAVIVFCLVKRLMPKLNELFASAAGGIVIIIGMVFASVTGNIAVNPAASVILALISAVISAAVIWCLDPLDYRSMQYVEFEDESNYYKVKVIPKMNTVSDGKKARRRRPVRTGNNKEEI